jgi:uncharacterized protein YgiM (DUF1202 family)
MYDSKRSHRHIRLLAVLSIVMLLTSVFPWYQAAAQDATPDPADPGLTTESLQTDDTGEGDGATLLDEGDDGDTGDTEDQGTGDIDGTQDTGDEGDTTPPSLTYVAISCTPGVPQSITATVGVANPPADSTSASVVVDLYGNVPGAPVDFTLAEHGGDATGSVGLYGEAVEFTLQLPASAFQVADTVIAGAYISSDPSATAWSDAAGLTIHAVDGISDCGPAPTDPSVEDPGTTDPGTTDPGTTDEGTTQPSLTDVSISCASEGSDSVTALVAITDPPADATTVSAQLYADGTPIGTAGTAAIDGAAEVPVTVTLPASDIGTTSVTAKAWITGDDTTAVDTSADLTVHYSDADGKTLCGAAPTDPGEEDPGDDEEPTPTVQYATVVNTGGADLRCRAAPVSGAQLGLFPAGARVEVRGAASGGWYPVVCPNGQDGFASAEYLKLEAASTPTDPDPGGTSGGVAIVQGTGGDGLRCRTAPVSGGTITVLADGTRLNIRGAAENGWIPVTCSGQAGWISGQYARTESGGGTTDPTPDPGTGTGKFGTVYNTGGAGLRCRTAPVSGATITVVPEGTKLETRGAAVNGWYPVVCNGQAGHVSGDYFTLTSDGGGSTPPVSGNTRTAMVSGTGGGGLRCRTAPVSGNTITVMPEGAMVEVRGDIVNGWAPVTCAGSNGWASAAYLLFNVSGGGTGELWMDVNLSTQYMRVYRGNTIIGQTYVSTGRPGFDTPTGTYYINWKLPSQTMTGVLGGEYYYVPSVPWVMYFTDRGHAIHGAYWHNNFGAVMSHGCINLPVGFAEWLYSITPYGARVRIHY